MCVVDDGAMGHQHIIMYASLIPAQVLTFGAVKNIHMYKHKLQTALHKQAAQ